MNIKKKTTTSHHNDHRGCCCCCYGGLMGSNNGTTTSSFNRYKNMHNRIIHNKRNKQKSLMKRRKMEILIMVFILITVLYEWKMMQPTMDYSTTTIAIDSTFITTPSTTTPTTTTTITDNDIKKNALMTDDRRRKNNDDDGIGVRQRNYDVTFFNSDDHHFDFNEKEQQQQTRTKCWISSHSKNNINNLTEIRLLGCGSDGHAFQTTMSCQRHDFGDGSRTSITNFDVDIVIKTNTTTTIINNDNIKSNIHREITIENMIEIDSIKEIYNTLILKKSSKSKQPNNNSKKRRKEQFLLSKHFMVPFATVDIPIEFIRPLLVNPDQQQHNSCHQNVKGFSTKDDDKTKTTITVAIMQYVNGSMTLDSYLKRYNKIASKSSSSSAYPADTNKVQVLIKVRSSLTKMFARDLVCMYQHMFTQNFVHDDMWLNHFLVNLDDNNNDTNNNNNDKINNNNSNNSNDRLPPTALSLIDYGRYTILNDNNEKGDQNSQIIVDDAYGNQIHIQVLQFLQLMELLGVICYNDIKFKTIVDESENSKIELPIKKQPPVSKKLYQIKWHSNFPIWMDLMAQCGSSNGSGNVNGGGNSDLGGNSAKQLSLLYKTLFNSNAGNNNNDESSSPFLNNNVTIQLGNAYEILLQWIKTTFVAVGNNRGGGSDGGGGTSDDTYYGNNYDYGDNMCFS